MESLRDFTRMTLISALKLTPEELTLRSDLTIDFAVGGFWRFSADGRNCAR